MTHILDTVALAEGLNKLGDVSAAVKYRAVVIAATTDPGATPVPAELAEAQDLSVSQVQEALRALEAAEFATSDAVKNAKGLPVLAWTLAQPAVKISTVGDAVALGIMEPPELGDESIGSADLDVSDPDLPGD